MKLLKSIRMILIGATVCGMASTTTAQSINLWRGTEVKADWDDAFKWKLKHIPVESEAVHFRQDNSVISLNRTVELNNGIQLYGQELSLEGNGNINLWSPIPHQRTIYIPASASGYANLTIRNNISINGRISLAAKAFGTSASKGSVTLKDRTTVEGTLSVGNDGSGSGKVYIHDKSVYRITGLELHTEAQKGGAAEIHILGGTAQMDIKTNPFELFLKDSSRKIIIGDYGTLIIMTDLPLKKKKSFIKKMLAEKRIVTEQGCELTQPVYQNNMVLLRAESTAGPKKLTTLLADIKSPKSPPETSALEGLLKGRSKQQVKTSQPPRPQTGNLSSLLSQLKPGTKGNKQAPRGAQVKTSKTLVAATPQTPNPAIVIAEQTTAQTEDEKPSSAPLAGYIAFLSAALLFLRPAKQTD